MRMVMIFFVPIKVSPDLTIKSSSTHLMKIKMVSLLKKEDKKLYGSTPHIALM